MAKRIVASLILPILLISGCGVGTVAGGHIHHRLARPRVIPPAHPSLRLVRPRVRLVRPRVRVVRARGRVVRARVVPWRGGAPARAAGPARMGLGAKSGWRRS